MTARLPKQSASTVTDSNTRDGPMDVTTNMQHSKLEVKELRRHQYAKYVDMNNELITAAGNTVPFSLNLSRANLFHLQVRKWLKNGQVSVAQHPCSCCVEINSLRPSSAPAFCCLVRAKYKLESTDGSASCAMCYATGNFKCSARAQFPQISNSVGRRTSLESLTRPRRTAQASTPAMPNSNPLSAQSEILLSVDEMYGRGTNAPFGSRLTGNRSATSVNKMHSYPSLHESQDTTCDREMRPATAPSGGGTRRTLSESSQRRKARFTDGAPSSSMQPPSDGLEALNSRIDLLQRQYLEQAEKINHTVRRIDEQKDQMRELQRSEELLSEQIERLHASSRDTKNVNYHLSRLVEVVEELQRSISNQKREIQTLKQASFSASAHLPTPSHVVAFNSSEPSTTLNKLRRIIDENDERQKQRKALYLNHLNRELQRTLGDIPSTSMDKIDVLTRRSDDQ